MRHWSESTASIGSCVYSIAERSIHKPSMCHAYRTHCSIAKPEIIWQTSKSVLKKRIRHHKLMPHYPKSNLRKSLESSIMKRRRGRQPRQSSVTPILLAAVSRLTSQLGAPIFLEEEGFRDISGWLKHIRSFHLREAWLSFCEGYVGESEVFHEGSHDKLKEDLIQEIMKLVITRHPKESAKVVLTNARRQSKTSDSGHTVRNVFEAYLTKFKGTQHAASEPKRREAGSSQSHARLPKKTNVSGRSSSSSRAPSSVARDSTSGIDIPSLLTNDKLPSQRHGSSSESPKLPSMTQFDEEIRSRSVKDRRKH